MPALDDTDLTQAMRDVLRQSVRARATLAVPQVGDFGLFPAAGPFAPEVHPVVVDANWLHDDVLRVCRTGKPTVLVTCAVEDFLRPFAAPHVMREVEEHAQEWCRRARVDAQLFLKVWREIYQPLLRVAEPDLDLLTAAELERIETLRAVDPDDIPSVTLSILLRAPYISTDGDAVAAVYGVARTRRDRRRMLALLSDAGIYGQAQQMAGAGVSATILVGTSVFKIAMAAARWPVLGLAAGGGLVLAGFSMRGRWREPVAGVGRGAIEAFAAAVAAGQDARAILDAETPATEPWEAMSQELPRRLMVARAAVHELARHGLGHLSAQDLSTRLPPALGSVSDQTLRAQLRRLTPDLVAEVFQGRWQVGSPWTTRDRRSTPQE